MEAILQAAYAKLKEVSSMPALLPHVTCQSSELANNPAVGLSEFSACMEAFVVNLKDGVQY